MLCHPFCLPKVLEITSRRIKQMADETTETVAADLDAAASEAVASQEEKPETTEEVVEEQVAETTEEVVEALDEDRLPTDHKERSDLGRKVSAYHRRVDGLENKIDRIVSLLETKPEEEAPEGDLSPDEPMTRRDTENLLVARDNQKESKAKSYSDNYTKAVSTLGPNLSQDEYDGVLAEMQTMRYDPSDNAQIDAEINFQKAENIYLRKKMAQPIGKDNPIKGEAVKGKLGVTTTQKTVVKETVMPKLDAHAQSYVDSVRRDRGDEAADKLMKDD
jgi:hypothetical protein